MYTTFNPPIVKLDSTTGIDITDQLNPVLPSADIFLKDNIIDNYASLFNIVTSDLPNGSLYYNDKITASYELDIQTEDVNIKTIFTAGDITHMSLIYDKTINAFVLHIKHNATGQDYQYVKIVYFNDFDNQETFTSETISATLIDTLYISDDGVNYIEFDLGARAISPNDILLLIAFYFFNVTCKLDYEGNSSLTAKSYVYLTNLYGYDGTTESIGPNNIMINNAICLTTGVTDAYLTNNTYANNLLYSSDPDVVDDIIYTTTDYSSDGTSKNQFRASIFSSLFTLSFHKWFFAAMYDISQDITGALPVYDSEDVNIDKNVHMQLKLTATVSTSTTSRTVSIFHRIFYVEDKQNGGGGGNNDVTLSAFTIDQYNVLTDENTKLFDFGNATLNIAATATSQAATVVISGKNASNVALTLNIDPDTQQKSLTGFTTGLNTVTVTVTNNGTVATINRSVRIKQDTSLATLKIPGYNGNKNYIQDGNNVFINPLDVASTVTSITGVEIAATNSNALLIVQKDNTALTVNNGTYDFTLVDGLNKFSAIVAGTDQLSRQTHPINIYRAYLGDFSFRTITVGNANVVFSGLNIATLIYETIPDTLDLTWVFNNSGASLDTTRGDPITCKNTTTDASVTISNTDDLFYAIVKDESVNHQDPLRLTFNVKAEDDTGTVTGTGTVNVIINIDIPNAVFVPTQRLKRGGNMSRVNKLTTNNNVNKNRLLKFKQMSHRVNNSKTVRRNK